MDARIDSTLHWLCLVVSRSQAARGCREGTILLNGHPVRPSQPVRPGDRITIADRRRDGGRTYEILALPTRQLSRAEARDFVRIVEGARPETERRDD